MNFGKSFIPLFFLGLLGSQAKLLADSFLEQNGVFTIISVPGAEAGGTFVSGINDMGQIAGTYTNSTGVYGFLDNHGRFTTIQFPGSADTTVNGINDTGEIVGNSFVSQEPRPFFESGGRFTQIETPGFSGVTRAEGINNAGQIVGLESTCQADFGCTSGFKRDLDGTISRFRFQPSGISGMTDTVAAAINDGEKIAGFVQSAGTAGGQIESGGFVYDKGAFQEIEVPGSSPYSSIATGINNSGQVVGSYQDGSGRVNGFVDEDGVFSTVDFPGSAYTVPSDINNAGEIVGTYIPVPEPGSRLLFGIGLLALVVLNRKIS